MNELSEHEFASPLRGKIFTGIVIAVFLAFVGRFVQLQVIEGETLSGAAIEQGLKRIERTPVRGTIYDRYGRVIAASVPSYTVAITRQDFDPYRHETMPLLSKILGVDSAFINMRLQKEGGFYTRFQPVKIWRDASPRIIAAVEENYRNLPGVDIIFESKREYIAPIRAAHLLGYTKEISETMLKKLSKTPDSNYYHAGDIVGTTGLENVHEKELRGVKGYEFLAVDARGQRQSRLNEGATDITAVDGEPIQLGLDIDLQMYAEQLMEGHHGAVVALDPNNGDILALVSKPDFDLDLFSGKTSKEEYQQVMLDPAHPLYNRALQSRYPPGSTWKLMMAAACLKTGTIPFDYKLVCPGAFTYGNHTYHDDATHGLTNVHTSIVRSCDVFYYKMVLMLGIDTMNKYAREFGFDQPTGVDIGHEGNGFVPNTKRMNKLYPRGWTLGYVVSQGIGQGEIGVTPIQQAAYAATWASHGLWVQPHAAQKIYNNDTHTWDTVAYKTRRVNIPDTVIEVVRRGMMGVVNEPGGTGHAAQIPNSSIIVAGKTGTSQNPHGKDHAWFVCFAPYDHPKIAIGMMVENAGFGGVVSAPIARKLMNLYLTGNREDPVPAILPNTDEYRALKEAKYSKDKAIAAAAKKKIDALTPAPNPLPLTPGAPKPAPTSPKPAPAKPAPAKPKPTAEAILEIESELDEKRV
jgi:penicillin-binding protein 2